MILDVGRVRPNNKMLVSKDQNCSRMIAGNTSGRTAHQCNISIAIEGWGLVYQEVGKSKIVSKCGLSGIL